MNFPSDLIIGPDELFFVLVNVALAENSMLVITKLVTDEGEEKGNPLLRKSTYRVPGSCFQLTGVSISFKVRGKDVYHGQVCNPQLNSELAIIKRNHTM